MARLYRILAKKATAAVLIAGVFLVCYPALAKVPNDPLYGNQQTIWDQIGAPTAWDYSTGSKNVVVAVIDTGIDTWNPDISANIWANQKEIADNGIDDDHNGYVDDVHGWNFVENTNDPRPSVFDAKDDPEAVSHGTLVAGLIGAVGDNGHDGTGLDWNVKIMPLRAIDSTGAGSLASVAKAVRYAVDNGAQIISMSFVGNYNDPQLKDELYRAYQKGVVVVAASGNHDFNISGNLSAKQEYPACYDEGATQNWMLTVASVNQNDQLSNFSDFGNCIDVTAPGEGIFSTERYAPQFGYPNEFGGTWEGTSFAAPLVAGAAALVKSVHPEWTPDQIIKTLLDAAHPIDALNPGYAGMLGVGRLDIGKAMQSIASLPSAPPAGSVYAVNGQSVTRFSVADQTLDTAVLISGAQVLAASPDTATGEIALLLKRSSGYFIRMTGPEGRFEREFSLPITVSKAIVVQSMQVVPAGQTAPGFVVAEWLPQKNQTVFYLDDQAGKMVNHFTVAGQVATWRISPDGSILAYATTAKNTVTLGQFTLATGTAATVTLADATAPVSLAVGQFWGGTTNQVAIAARRGAASVQFLVDIPSQSYRVDRLPAVTAANPWLLATVVSPTGQDILRYQKKGGVFDVVDQHGVAVSSVTVPKLAGVLQ